MCGVCGGGLDGGGHCNGQRLHGPCGQHLDADGRVRRRGEGVGDVSDGDEGGGGCFERRREDLGRAREGCHPDGIIRLGIITDSPASIPSTSPITFFVFRSQIYYPCIFILRRGPTPQSPDPGLEKRMTNFSYPAIPAIFEPCGQRASSQSTFCLPGINLHKGPEFVQRGWQTCLPHAIFFPAN